MPKKTSPFSAFIKKIYVIGKALLSRLSKMFDRIVYSTRASLVVSFLAAVIICVSVNFEDLNYRFFNKDDEVLNLSNVPVQAIYDTSEYVVEGLPDNVAVTLSGSPSDMALYKTQYEVEVVADLRNLSTGKNSVPLKAGNVPNAIKVTVNPSSAEVNIIHKTTRNYTIQPMILVGTGQSQDQFEVESMSIASVKIKATKTQLDSIRTVKALIDTSGQNKDFSTTAALVAYDSTGNVVNVEIDPSSIEVNIKYIENPEEEDSADKEETQTQNEESAAENKEESEETGENG